MMPSTARDTRPATVRRPGDRGGSNWRVPAALVLLSIIPVAAGSLRLLELTGGPQVLADNPRVTISPAPLILHVVAAANYALFGAFQFSTRLRRRYPDWHRRSGRVLVAAGLVVAGSGLWMTIFYTGAPGGGLLWTVRLMVSTSMLACIVAGFVAVRRHDIPAHRAWMIRAYALAVGAGTQVFTRGIGEAAFGTSDLSTAQAPPCRSALAGWSTQPSPSGLSTVRCRP